MKKGALGKFSTVQPKDTDIYLVWKNNTNDIEINHHQSQCYREKCIIRKACIDTFWQEERGKRLTVKCK